MSAIRLSRESFLSRLQSASPGLAKREIIEQSSCFVFAKGKVATFNDEVCCRIDSGLPKDLKLVVPAAPLLALLEKLPEDDVDLILVDGEVQFKGKGRRAGVKVEADIHLNLNAVDRPGEWRDVPANFDEALDIVSGCASSDDQRFSLTCVHVTPEFVEACDNFQLARYKIKCPVQTPCLVRRDALKPVVNLGMTKMSETDAWLHFTNPGGLIYSCRRYADDFPDLKGPLSVKGEPAVLSGAIAEAVDKADIFARENPDYSEVLVKLAPGRILIRGQGVLGWFEENLKTTYSGPATSFLISPKLLTEISKKHNSCLISSDHLKVKGERYIYVTVLTKEETVKVNGGGEAKDDAEGE